jgi:hypothetical protein
MARPSGFALALMTLALAGCGDLLFGGNPEESGGVAPPAVGSDIETLALLTQSPTTDSTELQTFAQLAVMSLRADPPRYLGGLAEPRLVAGALQIPLLTTEQGGVFGTDSLRSALRYQAGATYTFEFSIVDTAGVAQTVTSSVESPASAPDFEILPLPLYVAGEDLEITLSAIDDGGVVAVTSVATGGVTYTTFQYAGPATLRATLDGMIAIAAETTYIIPGAAFPTPGDYIIDVHSYGITSELTGSTDLTGPNSWLAAGTVARKSIRIE